MSVIVVTYRRPNDLAKCLDGLARQTRLPDQVVVTVRDIDQATLDLMALPRADALPVQIVIVETPGIVAARNAGLATATGDLLGFLDDDAVPHADWCARCIEHFRRDPKLGGLGGKDRLHDGLRFDEGRSDQVGVVQYVGRIIPNQHLGYGEPREVAMLKGANMIFRRSAIGDIRFDARLKGQGAQPFDDVAFGLAVRRAGWKLLYDPAVLVDHFSGGREEVRHYGTVDTVKDRRGYRELSYNEVVALWDEMSRVRFVVFAAWSVLVGTRITPGIVQAIRFTPQLGRGSWDRFMLTQHGRLEAWRDMRNQGALTP